MNKKDIIWYGITLAIILLSLFIFSMEMGTGFFGITSSLVLAIIILNLSVFIKVKVKTHKEKKQGIPPKDERILYIEGRSSHYAFIITIWFILGLMWYSFFAQEWLGLPELELIPTLITTIIFGVAVYALFRVYYSRA